MNAYMVERRRITNPFIPAQRSSNRQNLSPFTKRTTKRQPKSRKANGKDIKNVSLWPNISDHCIITCTFNIRETKMNMKQIRYRYFKKADIVTNYVIQ